jgi:hypothetical protein
VDFNITDQLLIIYFEFVTYFIKDKHSVWQCISYLWTSRKPMIQLGGRSFIIISLSLVNPTYYICLNLEGEFAPVHAMNTYKGNGCRTGGPKNNRNLNVARELDVAAHRETTSSSRAAFKFRLFWVPLV